MPSPNDKTVSPIGSLAGVKRDGTQLDGNFYQEALWCRFRNGRPKKMGGFRDIVNLSTVTVTAHGPTTPIRRIFPIASSPLYLLYAFHGNGVTGLAIDQNGLGGGTTFDRTPAGFTAGDLYTWAVDALYDSTGTPAMKLIAHPGHDLQNIADPTNTDVYYGDATDQVNALTSTGVQVSGGCVVLQPCLFVYGNNGLIKNSDANKPNVFSGGVSNEANVAGTKIVKGMPIRGGSATPAGLFWSLDSLIRVSFIGGGTAQWRYDTISDEISVLSKDGFVEYDGVYYWVSVDRFMMYDGVVKEVPNPMNQDFFFDNLNFNYRQKVWATKLQRWGEIWWFFPKGSATECNHAVVYNVREKTWYDTPIARSAGHAARELYFPVWADSASNVVSSSVNGYRIFRHEFGVDAVVGESQTAINSYFETSDLGYATGGSSGQPQAESPNVMTRITKFEPDLAQVGPMTVEVRGTAYPEDTTTTVSDPVTFTPLADGTKVDLSEQRRLLRLRIGSNAQGGNYHGGKSLVHLEPGDERP